MKTVWIVGASAGIGKALALKLAQEGYNLVLSARTQKSLLDLQKLLPKNCQSLVAPCDVVSGESLKAALEKAKEKFGVVDTVVFAAGIYQPMFLKDYNHEMSLQTLEVNLKGAFNLYEVLYPQIVDSSSCLHLVWIASVAGYRGLPGAGAYGVSKAALINFAEIQRAEFFSFQTKVQVVNPGFVKTRLTDKNTFAMPLMITPEQASHYIFKGMKSDKFEISFPPLFIFYMKILKILPQKMYDFITRKLVTKATLT